MTLVVVEISGADSIAAALRYAEKHPGIDTLVPTYVSTGTEFGDFSGIEGNVSFLREELRRRGDTRLGELVRLGDPTLWRAINGRFASVLAERFGSWLPCVGCHLYLHLMRLPLAQRRGASVVISGERENHDGRMKANQTAAALDAYASVLAHAGVQLALPVRSVATQDELDEILGEHWPGGSPQLACVLSGNERDLDGVSAGLAAAGGLIDSYIVPVGTAIADAMIEGRTDWDAIVTRVLREAGA